MLLLGDFVQSELEIDEGAQKSEKPVQTHVDRFAAVVVLEQFFAEFIDHDNPEEPGEEKTESSNEGSDRPVEGTGPVVDFANPDAKVQRPRHRDSIDGEVAIGIGNEPECKRLSRNEREQQKRPMNPWRRWIDRAVARSRNIRGLAHTLSYPEVAIPKRRQTVLRIRRSQ